MRTLWQAVHRSVPARPRFRWATGGVLLSLGLLAACGRDTTGPAINNSVAYWQLRLNHRAVTLALTPPYDTVQLVATPLNAAGAPIADTGTTTYTVNSSAVHVDAAGVLHADGTQLSNLKVYASRTIGGVTWRDSVLVRVNATPTTVGTLKLSGNTDFCPVNEYQFCYPEFDAIVTDSSGATLSNVATAMWSSDALLERQQGDYTNIVRIQVSGNSMYVYGNMTGHVTLYTEATVYGRSLRDSVLFTVGPSDFACVYVFPSQQHGQTTPVGVFNPGTITIGEGGSVKWLNAFTGHTIDVQFDDASAVQPPDTTTVDGLYYYRPCEYQGGGWLLYNYVKDGGGNIAAWPAVNDSSFATIDNGTGIRARTFPTAGTYHYHSAEYGTSGTVIVVPNGGTWDPFLYY